MPNAIKSAGEGVALQVTEPSRVAGLVEEGPDGTARKLAEVRVYSFDGLLVVVDLDTLSSAEITELVVAAARDTKSIGRAMEATVQIAGNGYQVQLPPAADAGFVEGDEAPTHTAPGLIVISTPDDSDSSRLARDLTTIRQEQL